MYGVDMLEIIRGRRCPGSSDAQCLPTGDKDWVDKKTTGTCCLSVNVQCCKEREIRERYEIEFSSPSETPDHLCHIFQIKHLIILNMLLFMS